MSQVEIQVEGHLDPDWADWLEGFTLQYTEDQKTILTGTVHDQSALYGLIGKLRDLGLKLISIHYGESGFMDASTSF
jgi:hypothetical protein